MSDSFGRLVLSFAGVLSFRVDLSLLCTPSPPPTQESSFLLRLESRDKEEDVTPYFLALNLHSPYSPFRFSLLSPR